jgi:predicted MPP superfamily phosphohydrolase
VWSGFVEPRLLVVHEVAVATWKWPAGHPPLRIVALADLHIGAPFIDAAKVETIVARVNALEPDVVVLLGDYVAHGVVGFRRTDFAEAVPALRQLRARDGIFAVLGNHDWWEAGPHIAALLRQAGVTVLENDAARIAGPAVYWIAGIADDSTRRPDPLGTVASIPPGDPVIAIAHDPAVFADMPDRVAVTLAGHTHGGQVHLPFVGALLTASRAPRAWAYGHIVDAGRDLVVTGGIGTSILPIRFNMPPEILLVTLSSTVAR